MTTTPEAVFFPEMMPGTRDAAPGGVLFLNPGLASGADEDVTYTPELPMDPATARAWLEQASGYAGQFSSGDLLAQELASGEDFYSETKQAIVSDLAAMDRGEPVRTRRKPAAKQDPDPATQAQCMLLLALQAERAAKEMSGLGEALDATWAHFDQTLGLDPDDRDDLDSLASGEFSGLDVSSPYAEGVMSWKLVLAAFLRVVPPETQLVVRDAFFLQVWTELGVEFAPQGAEATDVFATAPGYTLLGLAALPEGRPELAAPRRVRFVNP